MILLRNLTLLLSVFVTQNCWACYSAPASQRVGVDEQIALASDVSVARVISATPLENRLVEYRFMVQQHLAGHGADTFTVTGRAPVSAGAGTRFGMPAFAGPPAAGKGSDTSFHNHTDPEFWQRGGGRVMNEPDCLIYPDFAVGGTYLVFLDSPWTWRSFEKIELLDGAIDDRDKWLAYVKAGLETRSKQ
jgi:hypothetical protein